MDKSGLEPYWKLSFETKLQLDDATFVSGLGSKLAQTVDAHLVSDVPVGAFLSGGMDSSMIVALMAQHLDTSFKTFAVGVQDQSYNELPYARIVADRYQSEHRERVVDADVIRSLPEMIWHLDEPSDPIAACQFQAASLASSEVKVVLGGDGGDELFAGFDRYLGQRYLDLYALVPASIRRSLIGPLLERLPDSFDYKSVTQKARWMNQLSLLSGSGERYAGATSFFRFGRPDKQALYGTDLWEQVGRTRSADVIVDEFERAPAGDALDRMLYADFVTRLPEHSLMLTDRMTMAHGLEARSPYLDHELVEYVAAFPSRLKIRRRTLKYVLRELAVDYLPREIVRREKQGFMLPIAYWFRDELYPFIERFLLDGLFVQEGIFRRDAVKRLLEEHRHSLVDHHVRLWMLLNLEVWHQIYIQGETLDSVGSKMESYMKAGERYV